MNKPTKWQRQHHWQGQVLKSRDFNDQFQKEAQLRWWHNRALHNAYGVSDGYTVTADQVQPVSKLTVERGLAYDCFGRELLLTKTETIDAPQETPPPDGWVLLVTYAGEQRDSKRSGTACLPGCHPWHEINLCWRPFRKVSIRDGVTLARLLPDRRLDEFFTPRKTRPIAQPIIGSGSTVSGNTNWLLWDLPRGTIDVGQHFLGLQITIDTQNAGFTDTPCYFAWLSGSFWDPALATFGETGFFFRAMPAVAAGLNINLLHTMARFRTLTATFGHIVAPSATQFSYRVWIPWLMDLVAMETQAQWFFDAIKEVAVCWIGIQDKKIENKQEIRERIAGDKTAAHDNCYC